MEIVYNKLVRDLIPSIIEKDNCIPVTRLLNDEEYKSELEKKLLEEYEEVLKTDSTDDRIEELADMLEIIKCLAAIEGKSLDYVIEIAGKKSAKRGGFDNKIFLEKTIKK